MTSCSQGTGDRPEAGSEKDLAISFRLPAKRQLAIKGSGADDIKRQPGEEKPVEGKIVPLLGKGMGKYPFRKIGQEGGKGAL